ERTMDGWAPDLTSAVRRALVMKNDGAVPDDLDLRPQVRSPIHESRAAAADAGAKIIDKVSWLAETEVGLQILGLTEDQIRRALSEKSRLNGRERVLSAVERLTSGDVA